MRLLKALVSFIVGPFGAVLGFIAGALAAWWVAQRMAFFE